MLDADLCLPQPEPLALELPELPTSCWLLDVETTGLDLTRGARCSELACVWVAPHTPSHALNFGFALQGNHQPLNHLPARPFAEHAGQLVELLRAHTIVGYNVSFDLRVLSAELARCGYKMPDVVALDLRALASRLLGQPCGTLSDALGLAGADPLTHLPAHRALPDVLRLASLLKKLCSSCQRDLFDASWEETARPMRWGAHRGAL